MASEILKSDSKSTSIVRHAHCRECSFWVTQQDQSCPNCGLSRPQKFWTGKTIVGVAAYLLFLLIIAGLMLAVPEQMVRWVEKKLEGIGDFFGYPSLLSIAGLLLLWASVLLIGKVFRGPLESLGNSLESIYWRVTRRFSYRQQCLKNNEQVILRRLTEIRDGEQLVLRTERRVKAESIAGQRDKLLGALENKKLLLNNQRQRFEVKLWWIELLRWQNEIEPLIADHQSLSHKEYDKRFDALTDIKTEGEELLTKFERQTELAATHDGREVIERLRECLASCEALRQSTIQAQTMAAIKGGGPEAEVSPSLDSNLERLYLFNARADAQQFSRDFLELEQEYARLEFDAEAARRLRELESEGGGPGQQ